MIEVLDVPVPETHIWPVVFGWIALYVLGRVIAGGVR